MRSSSFRALLLALAMVFQTIAGGWAVARAGTGTGHTSVSAHCARLLIQMYGDEGGAPASEHDHGMCPSCLLCDEPPAAAVQGFGQILFGLRSVAPVISFSVERPRAAASVVYAQSARGPPGFLA